MDRFIIFEKERDALLDEYLRAMGSYDLDRLRRCFEAEYKYDIENRDHIENILKHIGDILEEKK